MAEKGAAGGGPDPPSGKERSLGDQSDLRLLLQLAVICTVSRLHACCHHLLPISPASNSSSYGRQGLSFLGPAVPHLAPWSPGTRLGFLGATLCYKVLFIVVTITVIFINNSN